MSSTEILITILIMGVAVELTRFAPFLLFRNMDKLPPVIEYLGKVLPGAMMGMLIIYCFKDIQINSTHEMIPAAGGIISIVLIHLYKKNTILSIFLGTAVYMLLLRLV